jgi:hypothetical protein
MTTEHRFPLGGTAWQVWRDAMLRSAGFPAHGLDRLADPELGAVADEHLAGAVDAAGFEAAYAAAVVRSSTEVNRIAALPLVREAITWQNPAAVTLLDSLRRSGPPERRNSKRRYREVQLTRYWQRYCGKSETIGFFGPGLWVTLDPDVDDVTVEPGPDVIARRKVFLEPWTLTVYGACLADDPQIRPWLPPAPMAHHLLEGTCLRRHGLPPVELSAEQAAALSASDGRRPAVDVAARLVADPALAVESEQDAYRVLEELARRKLMKWDANLPIGPQTEPVLVERIAAIGDEALRRKAAAGLERLWRARDAVAAAAGDPERLAAALAALDAEFTATTGREARRRHGQTYAGRGLCYEDTSRDVHIVVGRRLLDDLAPAMGLMLQAARWVSAEVAGAYELALQELYLKAAQEREGVVLADIWQPAMDLFYTEGPLPHHPVLDRLAEHWDELFAVSGAAGASSLEFSSAELAERVFELFPAERPGWSIARVHSPDMLVCAPSVEAVNAGDYLAVMGEVHIAFSTLTDMWCNWSRPDPSRMLELTISDFGQPRMIPLLPMIWSRDAGRVVHNEDAPSDRYLGFARTAWVETDRLIPTAAVPVRLAGGRLWGTLPEGRDVPLIECFGMFLALLSVNSFRDVATTRHTPRITIDRMVVFRETWRLRLEDTAELMAARADPDQYLAARRLMRELGLPRRCFVRISTERKPIYVDFTSPLYVASLRAMLRAAANEGRDGVSVTISEMLPTPDQSWVPDREGRTYFGEFRLQLTDPAEPATHPR